MSTAPDGTRGSGDCGERLPSSSDTGTDQQQPHPQQDDVSVVNPPSFINVPRPEDMSCASSVTTHFQDAELFVPHMYPSAQNLRDSHDVEDPTFQPVTQQTKMPTTMPSVLPPLPEESPQDPTDSKSIRTSHKELDENRILKEQEKAPKERANVPSLASLESSINQKTQRYSVRQISFEAAVDAIVGPAGDDVPNKVASQRKLDKQSMDPAIHNKDANNPAISEMTSAAKQIASNSPSPPWIQDLPQPMDLRSLSRGTSAAGEESLPGAHAVQTLQSAVAPQARQPRSDGTMNASAAVVDDEEAGRCDIQSPPAESLAEARPVAEDDLPVATEDYGNKHRQRLCNFPIYLMEGIFFLFVIAGIVVGAVCGTGHCSRNVYVDGSSTMAPTTMRDAVAAPKIETVLTFILGREYFVTVEDSGQGYDNDLTEFFLDARQKAFDWIVNQDPMQLEYDSSNLVQRFLLVLFYFQTTRHQPWKQCNPPATAQGSSSSNFCYRNHPVTGETTNGIWGDQWLTKSHECQWAGVVCETVESKEKTVAELSLYGNHLNGPLPWEITQLPELTDLRLSKNILSGVLPPGLLFLDSSPLRSLDLDGNKFIGTVPARWFESLNEGTAQLTSLAVSSNRLTGTIPTEVCLLPLNRLVLENNTLTGPLPREIVNQTSLTHLYLGKNDLTGTLPSEIGLLTNLQILDLNNAYISGPLPSEIGLPSLLYQIILSNTNMEGTIPEELYTTGSDLDVLLLDSCNLSGSISSSLGLLTNLKWLHLSNNNFYGPLPNEIEALTNLRHLLVNGNQFTGTVPESVCQNLYVEGEFSNKVVADCLPNPETGVPFIQCSCCTSCCDDTGVCLAN